MSTTTLPASGSAHCSTAARAWGWYTAEDDHLALDRIACDGRLNGARSGDVAATASARCPSFPTTVRSWPPASTPLPMPRAMLPVPFSVKCTVRLDSEFEFVRGGGGS